MHISHETTTIRYRFQDAPTAGEFWNVYGQGVGEEIKEAYAESMKKWENVYFYSYDSDGIITKNKLINLVEVTDPNSACDLTIIPNIEMGETASTYPEESENSAHNHYSNWVMEVNLEWFFEESPLHPTAGEVNCNREYVGAHELGHVLGLRDVDYVNREGKRICGSGLNKNHHEEVLMGYGEYGTQKCVDITYKDIAGVAITRGFHAERENDDDHKWLNMGQQSDGKYKLVCSICNGVRHVTTEELIEYSYHTYGSCNNEHDLPDGNMMAVASYGNKDYYKCKYCRYVAPFSEIVTQNYNKICCSADYHKCVNTVDGLEYTFYEPHTLVDGVCTECTSHEYGNYMFLNKFSHQRLCACGATQTSSHYISGSHVGEDFVPCAGCGYLLDMRDDIHQGIMSITQVSVNGSYIRSDGIVVLVDEDIEAYLAGTLQFYHPEDVPVTQ